MGDDRITWMDEDVQEGIAANSDSSHHASKDVDLKNFRDGKTAGEAKEGKKQATKAKKAASAKDQTPMSANIFVVACVLFIVLSCCIVFGGGEKRDDEEKVQQESTPVLPTDVYSM
jgi:hypothetical protein